MNYPFEKSSFWDERFSQDKFTFGREPNEFFKNYLDGQSPARILFPGEGEGRHAVYAASQGWEAEAIDFSEEGRKKALSFAAESGIEFEYKLENIATYQPNHLYDLIAFVFIHPSPSLRKALFRRYLNFLKPGGKILMEVFSERQFTMDTGGPSLKEFLYSREELEDIFRGAQINSLTEQEIELKAGPYPGARAFTLQVLVGTDS